MLIVFKHHLHFNNLVESSLTLTLLRKAFKKLPEYFCINFPVTLILREIIFKYTHDPRKLPQQPVQLSCYIGSYSVYCSLYLTALLLLALALQCACEILCRHIIGLRIDYCTWSLVLRCNSPFYENWRKCLAWFYSVLFFINWEVLQVGNLVSPWMTTVTLLLLPCHVGNVSCSRKGVLFAVCVPVVCCCCVVLIQFRKFLFLFSSRNVVSFTDVWIVKCTVTMLCNKYHIKISCKYW